MRSLAAGLLAVGCAKSGGGPQPAADAAVPRVPEGPIDAAVNTAVDALERGTDADLDQAVAILEPLAASDPTLTATYDLGVAYLRRNRFPAAADLFQRVTVAQPENGDAWLGLGVARERNGQVDEALDAFQTAVSHAPLHEGLRVSWVGALRRAGKAAQAMDAAREALALHAKSMALYNEFGLACLDAENLVMAKFVFQKAIQEIDGAEQDPVLQTNLGWATYLAGDRDGAAEHLSRALALDPHLLPALAYQARLFMDDHNYTDTVPLLETAAGLAPDDADIQLTLGVAYRGVGRYDDAKQAYERALALDPGDPAPHFNLGILLGDYQKDYDGGVAALERYVAGGGSEAERARAYMDALRAEQKLATKRAEAEAERKARAEERERKEQLAAEPQPPVEPPVEPTASGDMAPSREPAPVEPTPTPESP